jgi:SPOR domain
MLRLFFLLLVLANTLFFAWSQGMLATLGFAPAQQREPQRLNNQIRPELVRVLPVQAVQGTQGTQVGAGTAAVAAAAGGATPTAVATAPATVGKCFEAGPFDAEQAARLRRALESWPLQAWRFEDLSEPGRWLVYMGKYANREAAARKVAELRQLSISPDTLDNESLQPGISLGTFDDAAKARERLAEVTRQGVRTARVVQEKAPVEGQRLKLPQVDDTLRERIEALRPALAGKSLEPCAA